MKCYEIKQEAELVSCPCPYHFEFFYPLFFLSGGNLSTSLQDLLSYILYIALSESSRVIVITVRYRAFFLYGKMNYFQTLIYAASCPEDFVIIFPYFFVQNECPGAVKITAI